MNPTTDRTGGDSGWDRQAAATCDIRGFHGPFALDRARLAISEKETATCMMCGKRVSTAEHLAAYQIAVFHGLAG